MRRIRFRLSISERSLEIIENSANQSCLSVGSVWEIAIKVSIGMLKLSHPVSTAIPQMLLSSGTSLLPIELAHVSLVETLPLHHRDPFDRLLIAQTTIEQMSIVSVDSVFDEYTITRIW
jgi:PIN domain nuclease of toxin-antitoxin system